MFFPVFLFIILVVFNHNVESQLDLSSVNVNCTVNYKGRILSEGQSLEINGKFQKVENCGLHRAYHACGTHLLYIINIVCQAIKPQIENNFTKRRFRRFLRRKLLTEACCESLCTVSEMSRYCPSY